MSLTVDMHLRWQFQTPPWFLSGRTCGCWNTYFPHCSLIGLPHGCTSALFQVYVQSLTFSNMFCFWFLMFSHHNIISISSGQWKILIWIFAHIAQLYQVEACILQPFLFFQLSFIQHSLMSPEVFCFADYPCHTVAIDILKAPPEDDNREIATW